MLPIFLFIIFSTHFLLRASLLELAHFLLRASLLELAPHDVALAAIDALLWRFP